MSAIPSLTPADDAETGLIAWAERGLVPDAALRAGIRRLCAQRLHEEMLGGIEAQSARFGRRIAELADSPLALHTDAANRQHYEVPAAFFQACLGRRLKYSSCYYPTGRETLDQAEDAMLELYGQRAGLADGQQILELGCGWGSLTLWMAEHYPAAAITAGTLAAVAERAEWLIYHRSQAERPQGYYQGAEYTTYWLTGRNTDPPL